MRTVARSTVPRANRKAGHCGARVILIVERKTGRSAGFPGERAGETEFTYWLSGPLRSLGVDYLRRGHQKVCSYDYGKDEERPSHHTVVIL